MEQEYIRTRLSGGSLVYALFYDADENIATATNQNQEIAGGWRFAACNMSLEES